VSAAARVPSIGCQHVQHHRCAARARRSPRDLPGASGRMRRRGIASRDEPGRQTSTRH